MDCSFVTAEQYSSGGAHPEELEAASAMPLTSGFLAGALGVEQREVLEPTQAPRLPAERAPSPRTPATAAARTDGRWDAGPTLRKTAIRTTCGGHVEDEIGPTEIIQADAVPPCGCSGRRRVSPRAHRSRNRPIGWRKSGRGGCPRRGAALCRRHGARQRGVARGGVRFLRIRTAQRLVQAPIPPRPADWLAFLRRTSGPGPATF